MLLAKKTMSLELGGQSKTIQYLNLTKAGRESSNDPNDTENCSVSLKFHNQPFVEDQSKYLCAVTRFSVPLVEVPTIKATSFQIIRHHDQDFIDYTTATATPEEIDTLNLDALLGPLRERFFDYIESPDFDEEEYPNTQVYNFDVPACFSFHEFMLKLQNLLTIECEARYRLNFPYQAQAGSRSAGDRDVALGKTDVQIAAQLVHRNILFSERVKFALTADMKFQVMVTDDLHQDHFYVKMSPAMFRMLQFQITPDNQIVAPLTSHRGRRFHGYMFTSNDQQINAHDKQATMGTSVQAILSEVNQRGKKSGNGIADPNADDINPVFISEDPDRFRPRFVVHTAHMCCADATRLRELVFISDVAVKSEGNAESTYKRFLCDYQIFNPTNFSYNIQLGNNTDPYGSQSLNIGRASTVTEVLPSHRIYASENASAGRWQELVVPAPLYEIEVRAMVKCWDYENNKYETEEIPLPAGMQYSVKLVFVSRENHVVSVSEKPNTFHS